jgi:Viral BACON domain
VSVDDTDILVFDRFTGTNNTTLEAHTPDRPGVSGWVPVGNVTAWLDGNAASAKYQNTVSDDLTYALDSGTPNGTIAVDLVPATIGTLSGYPMGGMVFRVQNNQNYWFAGYGFGSYPLVLGKVVGGEWSVVGWMNPGYPVGRAHRLQVTLNGPSIQVSWDGIPRLSALDEFNVTATRHGLKWSPIWDWISTLDNFSVSGSLPCVTELAPANGTLPAEGGSGSLLVSAPAGCTWSAVSVVPWLTVASGTGTGNGTVAYEVATNATWQTRGGRVYVGDRMATLTQPSVPPPLDSPCAPLVSPPSAAHAAGGGPGTFSVLAPSGCWWMVVAHSDWLVPAIAPFAGNGVLEYGVDGNTTGMPRSGTITVRDLGYGVLRTFGVDQAATANSGTAPSCFNGVFPSAATFDGNGGEGSMAVSAPNGCMWSASTDASWVTLGATSGSGDVILAFTVAPNVTTSERTATLTIGGARYLVTQGAGSNGNGTTPTCVYRVSPFYDLFGSAGGAQTLQISGSTSVCSAPAISTTPWIASSSVQGSGPWTIELTVGQNPGPQRLAIIMIGAVPVVVDQNGAGNDAARLESLGIPPLEPDVSHVVINWTKDVISGATTTKCEVGCGSIGGYIGANCPFFCNGERKASDPDPVGGSGGEQSEIPEECFSPSTYRVPLSQYAMTQNDGNHYRILLTDQDGKVASTFNAAMAKWNGRSLQSGIILDSPAPIGRGFQVKLMTPAMEASEPVEKCAITDVREGIVYFTQAFADAVAVHPDNAAALLAHEIGHLLALKDAGRGNDPRSIMSNTLPHASCSAQLNTVVETEVTLHDATFARACTAIVGR